MYDYIGSYVRDLASVVDMDAIRRSGLRIGVDPLGAAAPLWRAIADRYGVGVEAVNEAVDVAFGDDTGGNQHGIVTRATGLMHPEDYLAVAVGYLFTHRPGWRLSAAIGTTMTGSSLRRGGARPPGRRRAVRLHVARARAARRLARLRG